MKKVTKLDLLELKKEFIHADGEILVHVTGLAELVVDLIKKIEELNKKYIAMLEEAMKD